MASQRRGEWPVTAVVVHGVLGALSLVILVGAWYLGAALWQVGVVAAAVGLLHVGAVVAGRPTWAGHADARRVWVGFGVCALAMLVLVVMPFPGWSLSMLPSALCFPYTLWRLTSVVPVGASVVALVVAGLGVVLTEVVEWARLAADVPVWTRLVEGGLLMAVVGGVWLAALVVRRRREARRRAESERLAAAVAGERAGIRRDLHDVIAHTVTVMVARIEAAAVTTGDAATRRELGDIAEAGRDAHQGLRAMLATLGSQREVPSGKASLRQGSAEQVSPGQGSAERVLPEQGAAERVSPGQVPISLEVLPDLVASAASPLHTVTLEEVGERRALSLSAEVAVVRMVQEGVTNALRHLEPPVVVRVRLNWAKGEVVVEVRDDGGKARRAAGEQGTGLLGIEERVRTAGGTLEIVEDDGWTLRARLPTKEGA
ncbi:sensor histidine kinase [Nonomuraea sp. NPDC050328]|uniref:sensor histidine kinase n=1 Tax=Nonomuraea sp. NPDC050328 TaxID=3364361 RepID=UPI0037AE7628